MTLLLFGDLRLFVFKNVRLTVEIGISVYFVRSAALGRVLLYYPYKKGALMAETFNKRERERNKRQRKKEKQEKKLERKHHKGHQDWTNMLAYVDENGNLSSNPVDRPL